MRSAIFTGAVQLSLFLVVSLLGSSLFAAQARVTLRNGQIQVVDVVSADQNGIMWKGGRIVAPTLLKYSQIGFIDFQPPAGWREALQAFNKQEFDEAIAYFSGIASKGAAHYYPAPGNYSSQAMLYLVDCYVGTGKFAEISKVAPSVTAASLPLDQRYRAPIVAAWAELGKGGYEKAAGMVDAIKVSSTSAGTAELAFIKGYALEKAGKKQEAIQTYAGAYSLDFGSDTMLSRKALESSIRLLEDLGDKNRAAELQALVHIFAHTFSSGDLYPNASSLAHELLAKDLGLEDIGKSIKEKEQPKEGDKPKEAAKAKPKPAVKKAEPKSNTAIITLDFAEKVIRHQGKESPLKIGGIYSMEQLKQGKKGNFTRFSVKPGVELAISGVGDTPSMNRRRLVLEPGKGLSVMRVGEPDPTGEGFRIWVAGFEGPGLRLASMTFSGGGADFAFGSGDQARLEVEGLKPGQSDYQSSFSAEGTDEDFKTIELKGGFVSAGLYDNKKGGKFVIKQSQGRFYVSSISIELESPTSVTKENESE